MQYECYSESMYESDEYCSSGPRVLLLASGIYGTGVGPTYTYKTREAVPVPQHGWSRYELVHERGVTLFQPGVSVYVLCLKCLDEWFFDEAEFEKSTPLNRTSSRVMGVL